MNALMILTIGAVIRAVAYVVGERRRQVSALKAISAAVGSVRSSLYATLATSYSAMRNGILPGMPVPARPAVIVDIEHLSRLDKEAARLYAQLSGMVERLRQIKENVAQAGEDRSEHIREREIRSYTHLLTYTLQLAGEFQALAYGRTRERTLWQYVRGRGRTRATGAWQGEDERDRRLIENVYDFLQTLPRSDPTAYLDPDWNYRARPTLVRKPVTTVAPTVPPATP